jgi:RHS repeat-associated protein
LRVPPAPGGLAPELALTYASSTADGRTSATNNQSSWIGDGWELAPGFIERAYLPCAEDDTGGTKPPKVGDLCWRSDNASAAYAGGAGMLIRDDATGGWRNRNDDGSRIERLTGAGNGDDNGEYWKITTVNGTQYFFGSQPAAKSTWTVPVFGDDANEPCHGSTFDASHCVQAWRWNLDKVVDTNGNALVYTYDTETNSYGLNNKDAAVSYVRGGTLKRVEYGLRDGDDAVPATGRVEFTTADRCVPGSDCTPDKKDNWPDVTWDDKCDTATCKDKHSPTFWSTKRLEKITTQVRRGDDFTNVDSWSLDQQFPAPGDGEKASLWLKGITHTGHVGGSSSLPQVTFEGTKMANRVYKIDGYAPLVRYRITGVVSEAGGVISIKYAEPNCVAGTSMPANPESNTLRCFPQRWSKKDETERTDYFHKYVVEEVTESDRISSSTEQVTAYSYDGAAWHYDTSEFTKDDKRTWDEFRGFSKVEIRKGKPGDPSGPVSKTEQRFYRGMNGDKQPNGTRTASVDPSEGAPRADEDWLRGQELESITYLGDTDKVVGKTINDPFWRGPTATRGAFKAYLVRQGAAQSYTALAAGGWRSTRTEYTYNERGLLTETDDLGDTTTAADDRCTTRTYVGNTGRWLLDLVSREETVAVRCDATPVFPRDAIGDTRTAYDGGDFGEAPTAGNPTRTDELAQHPASGPEYVLTSTTKYDVHGRTTQAGDALGRLTKTSYTPAVGGPNTKTVTTNSLGHAVTTTVEPAWGQATKIVDANGRITETALDALGRTVEVWMPNRPRSDNEDGSSKFSYRIRNDAPTVVAATTVGPNGKFTTVNRLYDGLLRPRQVQSPAPGGGRLLTDTRYDSQGRTFKTTQPYYNTAAVDDELWVASDTEVSSVAVTQFDGAGRKVVELVKGGATELWRTTTEYGGDRVNVTLPKGGTATTTISDARGQTTELRQYKAATPTGAFEATKYTFTKAGQLASTTDPAGNTWRNTYDLRGNTVKVEDADRGTSTLTFDAAHQASTVTDARGSTLSYEYDLLGRKTAVKSGGTALAAWTYDTALKGKGQPASSTRYVGGAAYTQTVGAYSALNQPLDSTVTIPETEETLAGSYTTYAKINPDGSALSKAFPAIGDLPAETVSWGYDDIAKPITMSGGPEGSATAEYVTSTEYTRYGEPARVQLGETGKRVWQSYYYDTHTRRLERTIVDAEVSRPMQADVNYTYDPFGNITSVADKPQEKPADVQCFRYDHLRRITEAWTPSNGCATDPDNASLAGPAPYWQSFSYDSVGNRLTETQHAAAGDTVRKYAYPQAGAHAVKSVTTTTGAAEKTDEFAYDATGNTTGRALASGAQQLVWDAEGKLTKVTEAGKDTSFVYDADGNRLIRRDSTGRTLYLDGQELRLDKASGKRTGTRYYQHGDRTVAMRTGAGVTWLASDRQDTAQLAVDSASQQVTLRRQAPFGAPRGAKVAFPGEKGFVGGTNDATTALTHLGAREYDPLLGRFISVDPVMDLTDPQQMHGYTYSNNNPITHADPTGMLWDWVKKVAKFAAPVLGVVGMVMGAVTPLGIAINVAAFAFGAFNAIRNCGYGDGTAADCAMDVLGAVPVFGKLAVGATKAVRAAVEAKNALSMHRALVAGTKSAQGLAMAADNAVADLKAPGAAFRWMTQTELPSRVEQFGNGLTMAGLPIAIGCEDPTLKPGCDAVPKVPWAWNESNAAANPQEALPPVPRVVIYEWDFIGPRVPGSVVAPRHHPPVPGPRKDPVQPTNDHSAPPGFHYSGGGMYCPNHGGLCML